MDGVTTTDLKERRCPMKSINLDTLIITPEILSLISELERFAGAWPHYGRIASERLANLRKVATIESVGASTRIKGATLSNREIEALLSNTGNRNFKSRDEQEVVGYAAVTEVIQENWRMIPFTERNIKQLQGGLLKYTTEHEREKGSYKSVQNHVEAFDADDKSLGIILKTTTPGDTPTRMQELVAWTQTAMAEKRIHPLLIAAVFAAIFLAIRPFKDGNGRLSRILTTLLLLKWGYAHIQFASLESVIEQHRDQYYLALNRTQRTLSGEPDWQPWTEFFLTALQKQKQNLELKLEREHTLVRNLPKTTALILEIANEHGRVSVADAASQTGISRNTIKDHIQNLVRRGELHKHGAGRGAYYSLISQD